MTMIKGKTTADKEILPKMVNVGDPAFIKNGTSWVRKDGTNVEVQTKSLKQLLELFTPQEREVKAHA